MYKLKQIPEDFIVKEINGIIFEDNGNYAYFLLKKKNYNTTKAIETIANSLRIDAKNISFAGNKDRNAITEQVISIYHGNKNIEGITLKDIELKYLGNGNKEVYIGGLTGNEFLITIRNLENSDINNINEKIKSGKISMPNYFGQQRFSKNNLLVGRAIISRDFKEAIKLVLESNSDCNEKIKAHLQKQKNDFIGALKIMPFKTLKLYVHSYQSYLFNKTLEQYLKTINQDKNIKIPIVGFSTELNNHSTGKIIKKIMEQEKLNERDFIIRAIPDLSSEGGERNAFIKVNDFEIIKSEKDELNERKVKMIVSFSLPKGCYATVMINYLLKVSTS